MDGGRENSRSRCLRGAWRLSGAQIERRDYLRTALQSTLYKDIVKRFHIRSVQGIEDLALYLLSNIAREYSFNALSSVTKCRSVHTIDKYIGHLQEAYLVFRRILRLMPLWQWRDR